MKESSARVVEAPPEVEPCPFSENVDQHDRQKETQWLRLLWEQRRFLARVAFWGVVFSTILAFMLPKKYESTTRLMPPEPQSGSGLAMMAAVAGTNGGPGLSSLAGDLLGLKSSGALFVDILRGRTVQDRLIERFDLRKTYHESYWQDARKDLAKLTEISEDRKSGVITITVTDHDPQRSAQLAQAYVEELDRLVAQVSTSSARRERIFIEQRLQAVKQGLDDASRQFSEYASKNTTIDITAQTKATVEAAAKLEGELIASQSELEGLEQIYTRNNIRVRSLRARVDELRTQLHKIGGDMSGLSLGKNADSNKVDGQEFPSIRQLPLLGVKWADLYRETKVQETVYELLTKQYEIAKIQEAKEIPTVKVLDAAYVPEKKSFPPRLLIMVLGMLVATGLGSLWLLGTAAWQQMDACNPNKQLGQELAVAVTAFISEWAVRWIAFVSPKRCA